MRRIVVFTLVVIPVLVAMMDIVLAQSRNTP